MATKIPNGRGFDIVVWQKANVGAVFCAAYTGAGRDYLSIYHPGILIKQVFEMGVIHPNEFIGEAPRDLKIGGITESSKVPVRINPPLH